VHMVEVRVELEAKEKPRGEPSYAIKTVEKGFGGSVLGQQGGGRAGKFLIGCGRHTSRLNDQGWRSKVLQRGGEEGKGVPVLNGTKFSTMGLSN